MRLWNIAQRKEGKCAPREQQVLLGHERGVTCLAFVPEHKLLFSAGLDHTLLAWNPLSETLICAMRGHLAPIVHVEAARRSSNPSPSPSPSPSQPAPNRPQPQSLTPNQGAL